MDVFCGIDWAEDHHDIAVVDASEHFAGAAAGQRRRGRLAALTGVLAEHGDSAEDPIPVAIETPRGLLTACLRCRAQGLPDQPDGRGPLPGPVLGRGPEVRSVDAVVLANILRTDAHAHRPLLADSELAQAIAVLTRAQQDAVWACIAAHNKLRSHLREYYPGFLAAFAAARGGITRPEARAILAASPAAAAAQLTTSLLQALLKHAGRKPGQVTWKMKSARESTSLTPKSGSRKRNAFPM